MYFVLADVGIADPNSDDRDLRAEVFLDGVVIVPGFSVSGYCAFRAKPEGDLCDVGGETEEKPDAVEFDVGVIRHCRRKSG